MLFERLPTDDLNPPGIQMLAMNLRCAGLDHLPEAYLNGDRNSAYTPRKEVPSESGPASTPVAVGVIFRHSVELRNHRRSAVTSGAQLPTAVQLAVAMSETTFARSPGEAESLIFTARGKLNVEP
jgi:hypothetical protein